MTQDLYLKKYPHYKMETLAQKVAIEKLKKMQVPEQEPYIALLMMAVQDQVKLAMHDQQKVEDKIQDFLLMRDQDLLEYLGVSDRNLARLLHSLNSPREIAEVLLIDLLYEAMNLTEDNFPANIRIPGESPW